MFNVFEPEWDEVRPSGPCADVEGTDPAALVRIARVNVHAGGELLGSSLYELEPGAVQSPIHGHVANEELVVILSGQLTIRTLGGTRTVGAGDVVSCPRGEGGTHRIENRSDHRATFLMVTTLNYPDVVSHPATGEVHIFPEAPFAADGTRGHRFVVQAQDG